GVLARAGGHAGAPTLGTVDHVLALSGAALWRAAAFGPVHALAGWTGRLRPRSPCRTTVSDAGVTPGVGGRRVCRARCDCVRSRAQALYIGESLRHVRVRE